jgi:PilZ domain
MLTMDHRLEFRAPIDMLLNKYVAGTPHVCRASNISRGGILIHKLLEPERKDVEVVGLQFELPGSGHVITAAGRIVFEHPWIRATGIRFTNLADDHRALIERYILDRVDWKGALGALKSG